MTLQNKQLWSDYVMNRGRHFTDFWKSYMNTNRNICFILGLGFDPRMCLAIESILGLHGKGKRDCMLIKYDEGDNSPSHQYKQLVQRNYDKLHQIIVCQSSGKIIEQSIKMWSADNRRVGSIRAARLFKSLSDFSEYSDVILDVSAFPRGIFLPVISKLLDIFHAGRSKPQEKQVPNLHVVVAENPALDTGIKDEGVDEHPSYLHGFGASIQMESTRDIPKVWIPVLGEHQETQLVKIRNFIDPQETCPVVPFPSSDPRRSDSLILQYHRFLFDDLNVNPSDILYVDERNPFQAYRQIRDTIMRYHEVFKPLGGCKAILSAFSSKLLSLGVLLATYELKRYDMPVSIAHIDTLGYSLQDDPDEKLLNDSCELFHLWLDGDCYES